MKDLVKVDGKTCLSCKYHVGFGAQPGSQCRDNTKNFKNVCCNYLRTETIQEARRYHAVHPSLKSRSSPTTLPT